MAARDALLALADVIEAAELSWLTRGGDPLDGGKHDYIAAAVRAHILSDAVVERAADGIGMPRGVAATQGDRKDARAALAAAVGGEGGGHG